MGVPVVNSDIFVGRFLHELNNDAIQLNVESKFELFYGTYVVSDGTYVVSGSIRKYELFLSVRSCPAPFSFRPSAARSGIFRRAPRQPAASGEVRRTRTWSNSTQDSGAIEVARGEGGARPGESSPAGT
jgi:hypothetical protein